MTRAEFEREAHRWYDPLYRFALSLCNEPEQALDLTQHAFHRLAQKRSKLRRSQSVKTWLFSVLYRSFVDEYRHAKRFPKTNLESLPALAAEGHSPDRVLDGRLALQALQDLEEKFRAPLALFYLEELSYKEIAACLDVPIGTVMSRLRRGKDRLRDLLETPPSSQPQPSSKPIPFRKQQSHG